MDLFKDLFSKAIQIICHNIYLFCSLVLDWNYTYTCIFQFIISARLVDATHLVDKAFIAKCL